MQSLSPRFDHLFTAHHWLAIFLTALLLAACQPVQAVLPQAGAEAPATIPEVLIEVNDTEFTLPTDFPGGIVAVTVQNNSSQDLDVGLTRVREGSSVDELIALNEDFMSNLVPIMQKASFLYSFNPLPAGGSGRAIIDFKTGEFIVDATEHAEAEPLPGAKSIYGTFNASQIVGTTEPQADVTVEMTDFAFIIPDEIKAGKQMWQYKNTGEQWHMIFGITPVAGATIEDVKAAIMQEGEPSGPPPFEFAEDMGIPPIGAGERVWVEHEIAAGTYLMACPLPDVVAMMAGGELLSHLHHGMHRLLTVTGDSAAIDSGETPASTLPQVTITAKDFAFEMPAEIAAGWTSITFTNEGAVNHHGYVMRLLDGVTRDDVMAAIAAESEGTEGSDESQFSDLAFFLPDTDPGTSNQATVELVPGNWMIVSFSMDPASGDPAPDWAKGSIAEFIVTETEAEAAAAPEVDLVVTIDADDFDMPAEMAAGEQTLQVVNQSGAEDGYIFFVKLGGDTTVESVLAAFEAMFSGQDIAEEDFPEISTVGGLMGYNLGDSFYTTINLEPGNYAAISSINGNDFPYAGLYKNFTVK